MNISHKVYCCCKGERERVKNISSHSSPRRVESPMKEGQIKNTCWYVWYDNDKTIRGEVDRERERVK